MAQTCRDDLPDMAIGLFSKTGLDRVLLICPTSWFIRPGRVLINRDSLARLERCPLFDALRTQTGHRLRPEKCHVQTIIAFPLAGFQPIQKLLSLRPFRESSGNPR